MKIEKKYWKKFMRILVGIEKGLINIAETRERN